MTSVDRVAEGSETIATEENCPPNLMVTLSLIQTLSLTGGGQFSSGVNCPNTVTEQLNKEHLNNYLQR